MSGFQNGRRPMSVGRALPGMMDIGKNASSNIKPTSECVDLLVTASNNNGAVKVEVEDEKLVGTKLFAVAGANKSWKEKLDALRRNVDDDIPCWVVIYRSRQKILLVKYIPENAMTKTNKDDCCKLYFKLEKELNGSRGEGRNRRVQCIHKIRTLFQNAHQKIAAPLTEAEIARKEEDKAETAGAYSLLARLNGNTKSPVALPGMAAKGGSMPSVLNKDDNKKKHQSLPNYHSKAFTGSRQDDSTDEEEEEEEEDYDTSSGLYPLKALIKMKELREFDDGMDEKHLEMYLVEKQFKKLFKTTKDEFETLPVWKQTLLKKQHGLF
eukprot:CAMPEP_0203804532 /NCGR_PEP_ID=MMETSP0100_2-20121128/13638_1 /ASSEMBLY_ACC=CAM_ASM_000210 /TAXON_ID=96639 /ORGANISM=" , Strain NY0313808BC1" /LENGTH=323 /DNA_ID=CAMNT_0050712763 /DNA_START=26 /DNA_END=997 /DNA_ORIENTATION=+